MSRSRCRMVVEGREAGAKGNHRTTWIGSPTAQVVPSAVTRLSTNQRAAFDPAQPGSPSRAGECSVRLTRSRLPQSRVHIFKAAQRSTRSRLPQSRVHIFKAAQGRRREGDERAAPGGLRGQAVHAQRQRCRSTRRRERERGRVEEVGERA